MAITNDFSKFGTSFTGAYHRINRLGYEVTEMNENVMIAEASVDEEGTPVPPVYEMQWVKRAYAHGDVATYANAAARAAHEEVLARTSFNFQIDLESADNWMEQAYAYIKTMDVFADATDVL